MTDTTAKIRSKGLDATGVTERIAEEMFNRKGAHYMAIVEIKVDATHETADGKRGVDLILTQVEPATDDNLAEHLRELTRTVYFNRKLATDGPQLQIAGDSDEPTVDAVIAAGRAHRPHPFIAVDASQDTPICDVCGELETAPRHSTQELLTEEDDDQAELEQDVDEDLDDDQEDEEQDEEDEPALDQRPSFSSIPGGAA